MSHLFKFVNDLHLHAPNALDINNPFNPSNPREYYIGDNLDMTNCKKKDVQKVQREINFWRDLYGYRFITGNHEAQRDSDTLVVVKQGVGVMHGDDIFWGREKSLQYRRKEHGAGFLKRSLWVNALEAFENGYDRKVSEEDLVRFDSLCKHHGVPTIIVGHMHPKETFEINRNGNKLIVLKRGVNELCL